LNTYFSLIKIPHSPGKTAADFDQPFFEYTQTGKAISTASPIYPKPGKRSTPALKVSTSVWEYRSVIASSVWPAKSFLCSKDTPAAPSAVIKVCLRE
jgi:hypothetical protein